MGFATLNEQSHTLVELAPAAKCIFKYEYDFGDGWLHEIKVEKVLPPDANFKHPVCLAGANACPPDDCGGMGGYYNLLATLANPRHPDHASMKDWLGGDWNAEAFDVDAMNSRLKRIKM